MVYWGKLSIRERIYRENEAGRSCIFGHAFGGDPV